MTVVSVKNLRKPYGQVRAVGDVSFAPLDPVKGVSPWAWHDLLVIAAWGAAGCVIAVWRFKWSPRRN